VTKFGFTRLASTPPAKGTLRGELTIEGLTMLWEKAKMIFFSCEKRKGSGEKPCVVQTLLLPVQKIGTHGSSRDVQRNQGH
jgi:hypothetical protein